MSGQEDIRLAHDPHESCGSDTEVEEQLGLDVTVDGTQDHQARPAWNSSAHTTSRAYSTSDPHLSPYYEPERSPKVSWAVPHEDSGSSQHDTATNTPLGTYQAYGNSLSTPYSELESKPLASASPDKPSTRFCHQCRHKRPVSNLLVCVSGRNRSNRRRACKLAYCRHCIERWYTDIDFNTTLTSNNFMCPRCENSCLCTNCTSRRGEAYEGPRRNDNKPKPPPGPSIVLNAQGLHRRGDHTQLNTRLRTLEPSIVLQIPIALPRAPNPDGENTGLLGFNGIPLGYLRVDKDGGYYLASPTERYDAGLDHEIDELEGDVD
ncbi:unnamed protein product [Peniophora sp. CBMAI 1063]|nr:unnamed protein product [Peniophora sp. CBMAI 1063]